MKRMAVRFEKEGAFANFGEEHFLRRGWGRKEEKGKKDGQKVDRKLYLGGS